MICPNCGTPYDTDRSVCPVCNTPLGNAPYTPVGKSPGKKGRGIVIFLGVLSLILCLGCGGYFYYLKMVAKECREVTVQLMQCAHNLDFSPFGKENLPSPLSEKTDVKKDLAERMDALLEEQGILDLLETLGIDVKYDRVYEQILSRAGYEITDVKTSYNRCTVTMTTSNINYSEAVENTKESLSSAIDDLSSPGDWWSGIKEWFSSFLGEGEDAAPADDSGVKSLTEIMEDYIQKQEPREVTGTIVYGIKGGKWTLISVDPELFYNYYGFPQDE
ncbi:MAG: hypothetical protein IKX76_01860 [Eubacterium sp.]|nr:hypothetical protein [Eubacterium sp.]